jgi:hypothetical protein
MVFDASGERWRCWRRFDVDVGGEKCVARLIYWERRIPSMSLSPPFFIFPACNGVVFPFQLYLLLIIFLFYLSNYLVVISSYSR